MRVIARTEGGGRRRTPRAGLACFVSLVVFAPTVSAQGVPRAGLTAEEEAWLDMHGPLRLLMTNFEPWLFADELGEPAGIAVDLVRLMRVKMGLEFQFVRVANVSAGLAALRAGEADLWAALGKGAGRDDLLFGEAYAVNGIQAWGPASSVALAEREFAGARVAVVRNSTQSALLADRFPDAIPFPVSTQRAALDSLRRGEADAWLGLQATALYLIRDARLGDLVPLTPIVSEQTMHFAVHGNNTILMSILEKSLASIGGDERAAIYLRWTGTNLSVLLPTPPTVSLRAVGYGLAAIVVAALVTGVPLWIVTLRHRVAERTREIQSLNASLERRVSERTRALEASEKEMEAFAYSVSHDLRAPLRAIDGFSRSLLADHSASLDEAAKADLERVRAGSQRMGALIDDLLRLSRVGRAEMSMRDVDLSSTASRILEDLRRNEPARDVATNVEPGLRAIGDPQLLEVALANVLDNAWKFTSRRERATIEFGRTSTPRGEAFFVRDNGAGFEPEFAGKLFAPFQRLHSVVEFPGTGIGLATVRRIIGRHGGDVWAEGEPTRGATFYFTLPGRDAP